MRLLLFLFACAHQPATRPDGAAERAQVKAVVDRFFADANRRDWDAVGQLLADDFEIFVDEGEHFDKRSYVDVLKKDDLEVTSLKLSDMEVHVDGAIGWCRYHASVRSTTRGQPNNVETLETLIFRRDHDVWTITHAHVSLKKI